MMSNFYIASVWGSKRVKVLFPSSRTAAARGATARCLWQLQFPTPSFVAPYRKNQKIDGDDSEAIGEAVGRPLMRFVPIKNAASAGPTSSPPDSLLAHQVAHSTSHRDPQRS